MTKIKPGVYVQEINITRICLDEDIDLFLNSFLPKMFYRIECPRPYDKIYVLVPEQFVSKIEKELKEAIMLFVSIEVISDTNFYQGK